MKRVKKDPSLEDIDTGSLNIKISARHSKDNEKVTPPKHKESKASPDLTTKSTHDKKKTIIIRDSSCGSQCGSCHHQQQSPYNGVFMQQLQMMRQVQEDQFKMMQLVMQSRKGQEGHQQCCMPMYGQMPFQPMYPYPYDPRYGFPYGSQS